jgi:hypothetical protein
MTRTKNLRGPCQHCGGALEFPAELAGTTGECPLCHQATEFMLALPAAEPAIPQRLVVWTVVLVAVAGTGLGLSLWAVHLARGRVQERARARAHAPTLAVPSAVPAPALSPEQQIAHDARFGLTPVQLEKATGSSLVYATGTLTNQDEKQRFGVTIEFELLDGQGQKLGTTSDYQATIEPRAEWKFRAMVTFSKAASARLVRIREQP